VPVAMAQDRRPSDRRPGLSDVGGEHEAFSSRKTR
jgi:hypothetical protein